MLFVRTVPPGAKVLSDGQLLGDSDDVFPIEPGTHRIAIELNGYEPKEEKVAVRRGEVTRLTLELKKRTAVIAPRFDAPAGKDAFYKIPIGDLKITAGKLPELRGLSFLRPGYRWGEQIHPCVVLDGPGEVYFDEDAMNRMQGAVPYGEFGEHHGAIVVRAAEGKDVAGRLFVPAEERFPGGIVMVRFTVPASAARPEAREQFYLAKLAHYENLRGARSPAGPGSVTRRDWPDSRSTNRRRRGPWQDRENSASAAPRI